MIETICGYPMQYVAGGSALVGALGVAVVTILKKKKELGKKFKFEPTQMIDTIWQSCGAGIVAAGSMTCGYVAVATAIVTGIGTDKIANKLQVYGIKPANVTQWLAKLLELGDKKVSKKK